MASSPSVAAARANAARWYDRFDNPVEVGRGGAATVYKADDTLTGRCVALKRFREDAGFQPARIRREIEMVRRLDHPGIVKIVDVIDYEPPEICLVLEFLPGGDLQRALDRRGALPFEESLRLGVALAEILAHAHDRGVVHRDLKPSNVLLDDAGAPRLTDFGLARAPDLSSLTSHGQVVGTYDYLAPEQRRDAATATPRSDIFAFGKTLYAAITGQVPHTIREGRLPESIREVVLRCLEEDPRDRYGSMHEVLDALRAASAPSTARPDPVQECRFELVALDRDERPIARFGLREGANLVGVLSEGNVPEVDLTPVDKHQIVSRRHARIDQRGGDLQLTHLSHTNPTHLNGRIVRAEASAALAPGDRIVLSTNVALELRRAT